jgi:exopolyphosphatase/guanosine-5'-triphosphate,3'-diphosphate pyrophosphatase
MLRFGVRKAVVDVGSNSVLLTVEEREDGAWRALTETSEVTGLGEGTKETGLLGEGGMARTLAALRRAFDRARETGVGTPLAAATMAARIASNTDEFLRKAEEQGTPVFVLPGEQEAELGFRAVANDPAFAAHRRLSIVDVGGHSTELVTADREPGGWTVRYRRSFPLGTLGLKGTLLRDESPGPMEVLRATAALDDLIGLAYLPSQGGHAVALGATGTNLVTIRDRMTEWDSARVHGAWLDYEEVSKAVGWMMPMTEAHRAAIPGIEPGREGTIHIGSLILERFLHALRVLGCSVSVRGWRHALLESGLPEVRSQGV